MGLFVKRPLCLLCCLFVLCSLLFYGVGYSVLLYGIGLLLLICSVLFVFWRVVIRHRLRILFCLLCVVAILLALVHSLLTVALPAERAKSFEGDRVVLFRILSVEYEEKDSAEYVGAFTEIDGESVWIYGRITCDFACNADVGDRICVYGLIRSQIDDDDWLVMHTKLEEYAYVQQLSESLTVSEILFSRGGLRILGVRISEPLGERLSEYLGTEIGGIADGFLIGDQAEISSEVIRDFRRAGVSHVMAVSGQHITILLGGLELILRKLFCPRSVRCGIVAVCGGIFLMLTGFSLSCCRALLMLFSVYLHYFLAEENDSVTALFASFAVIIVFSPSAAVDVGLWMSFLATLGLITVYPLLERRLPYPRSEHAARKRILLIFRSVALVAAMTVVAEIFLLPVIWAFFREFSLISILCNVVLSPLVVIFLYGILLCLALGGVPLVGVGINGAVRILGEGILFVVGWCSRLPVATVSLKYGFCTVIILFYAVAMVVVLLLPIKRKWILGLPSAVAVLTFVICLTVTSLFFSDPVVVYHAKGKNKEWISVESMDKLSVFDMSSGGNAMCYDLYDTLEESMATEIDALILTHYHKGHSSMVIPLMRRTVVRRLYLPIPKNTEELSVAAKLANSATVCKTQVIFYASEDELVLFGDVSAKVGYGSDGEYESVAVQIMSPDGSISYGSIGTLAADTGSWLWQSDMLLVGSHGREGMSVTVSAPEDAVVKQVIYTDQELVSACRVILPNGSYYTCRKEKESCRAEIPLS